MLFVDAGAWIALYVVRDDNHADAELSWRWIRTHRPAMCTTNLVVAEVATLLGRRIGNRVATERTRRILESPAIQILRPEIDDELAALTLMDKYADHHIGFVDCVSFVAMKNAGITSAFTYDKHFMIAGFGKWTPPV